MSKRSMVVCVLLAGLGPGLCGCAGMVQRMIVAGDLRKRVLVEPGYSNRVRKVGVLCYREPIVLEHMNPFLVKDKRTPEGRKCLAGQNPFLFPTVAAHTKRNPIFPVRVVEGIVKVSYILVVSWVLPVPLAMYDSSFDEWNKDTVTGSIPSPWDRGERSSLLQQLPRGLDSTNLVKFLSGKGWDVQPVVEHKDGLAATLEAHRDDLDAICVARIGITIDPWTSDYFKVVRSYTVHEFGSPEDRPGKMPILMFVRVKARFFDTKTQKTLLSFAAADWSRTPDESIWGNYTDPLARTSVGTLVEWRYPEKAMADLYQSIFEKALSGLKMPQPD